MQNNVDMVSMIKKFYRYKLGVLVIVISMIIGASIYIKMVVPIYLSSILIDVGENESLDVKSLFPHTKMLNIDMENKLEYDASILKSQHVMNEVLKKIDFSKRFFIQGGWYGSDSELYGNEIPFKVKFRHLSSKHHSCTLVVEPLDSVSFKLYLKDSQEKSITKRYRYGERITYLFYTLSISKNEYLEPKKGKKYLVEIEMNREILMSRILNNLSIEKEANRLLKLHYKDSIPERGKKFLTQLVFHYQNYILNSNQRKDDAYGKILDKKILFMDQELRTIGKKIRTYKSEHKELLVLGLEGAVFSDIIDKDRNSADLLLQLKALDATREAILKGRYSLLILENNGVITDDIKQLIKKLREKKEQLQLLKEQQNSMRISIIKERTYVKTLNELQRLERELTLLSMKYTERHPTYKKVEEDIKSLRISLNRYVKENIKNYEAEVFKIEKEINKALHTLSENLNLQFSSIEKSLESKRETIQKLPKSAMALEKLKREFKTKENSYKILLKKRVEISVTTNSISNIQIVDNASSTLSPIKPQKSFIYLSSLIIGFFLSLIYISFSIRKDRNIYSESDVESKGYQLISYRGKTDIDESFWRLLSFIDKRVQLHEKETFTILFTSSSYSEPKSLVIKKLSLFLNNISKKVLIIDFDIYNPEMDKLFNGNSKIGLSNLLTSQHDLADLNLDQCIYRREANIDVLPFGAMIEESLKLLFSDKIATLLDICSKEYDLILIDAPPMGTYPVTDTLIQYVDLLLIVAEVNSTDRGILESLQGKAVEKLVFLLK